MTLEEQIHDLKGQISILANELQYAKAQRETAYRTSKLMYEYMCEECPDFISWYQMRQLKKENKSG